MKTKKENIVIVARTFECCHTITKYFFDQVHFRCVYISYIALAELVK
jgi:phosphate starvation-inducible membrane PsiE